jgi:membrane protein DedA with SNARE-associated domain
MQNIIAFVEQHAVWLVFINVLLAQCGIPLPVLPTLVTAAALAGHDPRELAVIVAAGIGAALLGDLVPYSYGRRYGRRILGLLCRMSFSPDYCVHRTETAFARIGPWSLVFAKFIPGVSLVTVAMAGATRLAWPAFLALDAVGKALFVGTAVTLGRIFHDAIASVLATLSELGEFGVVLVVGALAIYVAGKWFRRQLFIRQLRGDRITVDELRQLMKARPDLVIVDVRAKDVRDEEGTIPGAVGAHPADLDPKLKDHPRDAEVVIYCACPNEASAAIAAKHLKRAGFKRIRPLLGGIDAWIEAGHPVERAGDLTEAPEEFADAQAEAA